MGKQKDTDRLEEIIKQKLHDYSLPVTPDSWDELEQRLPPPGRKIPAYRLVIAVVAIAACVLFGFFIFPKKQPISHVPVLTEVQKDEVPLLVGEETPEIVSFQQTKDIPPKKNSVRKEEQPIGEEVEIPPMETEIATATNIPETQEDCFFTEEKNTAEFIPLPKRKAKRKTQASFFVGQMGKGNLMAQTSPSFDKEAGLPSFNGTNAYRPSAFEVESYHTTFSFGTGLRVPVFRRFSVETGLVYNVLQAKLRHTTTGIKANSTMHSIGIPLNVTYHLSDPDAKWDFYLGMGGTASKGLVNKIRMNRSGESFRGDFSVKGIQYSFQVSAGVDYYLSSNWSVYFEPRVVYYADSPYPGYHRQEDKFNLGFNTGIRFHL